MTSFEQSIKRDMTRGKFLEIRGHVYGDGKNTFKYTYGAVASWFAWNRDGQGRIANVQPPSGEWGLAAGGHYYDGPLDWDQDIALPAEQRFSSRLTTDIVFAGLNMSGDGGDSGNVNSFTPFQNARGHRRIVKTFFGTQAEGGYFTDIIKPDSRIIKMVRENNAQMAESDKVLKVLKAYPGILREHIRLFKEELDFIGAKKPLLIVFGGGAKWVLDEGCDAGFLRTRFRAVVQILHYASYPRGGDEGYKIDTSIKLKDYIEIPVDKEQNGKAGAPQKKTAVVPPGSSDEKAEAYRELNEVKRFFESRGHIMTDPITFFVTQHSIWKVVQTSKNGRRLGFGIFISGNKYQAKYETDPDNGDDFVDLEKKFPEINRIFPSSHFSPGKGKNPRKKIVFSISDPKEEALTILEKTLSVLGVKIAR
jgi:hypothetical protein